MTWPPRVVLAAALPALVSCGSDATDDDLTSVFAYMRSLKPLVNHVPDYQPPATSLVS